MTAHAFELPEQLEAHAPPARRDDVRMLVADRDSLVHARFRDLPRFLRAGDLVVVNTSATVPAALPARRRDGSAVYVHLSTPAPRGGDSQWVVELRRARERLRAVEPETLVVGGGARIRLQAPYLSSSRLWVARLELPDPVIEFLTAHGSPIRYRYVPQPLPLADYQTIFATEPGSAEMPSAGRPFTHELVTELAARGVLFGPVTLHTGVSSPESHEPPYPERFRVPAGTARLVAAVRGWGGRVIAVGTTVVRALETAAEGTLEGWTHLVVTSERGLRVVDGLLTGWHEPGASHLQLLEAVAGRDAVMRSYAAALDAGYLWHEFGDVHLILPSRVERG